MQASQIVVKKERGVLVVKAMGKTGRGVSYVKAQKPITAKRITDKNFKGEMEAAVAELLGRGAYEAQYPLDIDTNGE